MPAEEVSSKTSASLQQSASGSKWSELEDTKAYLENAEHLVNIDATGRSIEVGNVPVIEGAIAKGKTLMGDFEIAVQAVESLCSSMQAKTKSDKDRKYLKETVDQLHERSDSVKLKFTRRHIELEDMLLECRQFQQMNAEFDRWIISLEEDLEKQHATVGETVSALEELVKCNKDLHSEALPWQAKVDALHVMAQKLSEQYRSDDISRVNNTICDLDKRWTTLIDRLTSQEKTLQNKLNSVRKFDTDLKDFISWINKIQVELAAIDSNNTTDSDRLEHLQSEIEDHQSKLNSLNAVGEQMIATMNGNNAVDLRREMTELNQMWEKITKSPNLRIQLTQSAPQGSGGHILKTLIDLNDWVKNSSSELNSRHSPDGATLSLSLQSETNNAIRTKLDEKQPEIERALKAARKYSSDEQMRQKTSNGVDEINFIALNETEAEARNVCRKIEGAVELLDKNWSDVTSRSYEWKRQIDEELEKIKSFDAIVDDTSSHLIPLEKVIPTWTPITNIPAENLQQEYNEIKAFHGEVIALKAEVDRCRIATGKFQKDECELPEYNMKKLDNVNSRWLSLESAVEMRLDRLAKTLKDYGPSSQYQLSMTVFPPWERSLADANKVPYFINHSSEYTQWDHPEMTRILQALAELNTVKFSAYRTSMKLRLLQKRLSLDFVNLDKFHEVLERNNLSSYSEKVVTVTDMINSLTSLFEDIQTNDDKLNIPLSIDLILNWILNLYDPTRSGQVRSLGFKVAIVIMCHVNLEEKYKALFQLVSNASGKVDQHRLGLLLHDCIKIPKQLGEIAAFGGSNVDSSVKSCFEKVGSTGEIEEEHFVEWMKLEPQSLVWIPVLHRLAAAEGARHQAKCNVCRECPIVGFRYRCLKCFNFDMCQSCFFSGRKSKTHKLSHPMQEYCTTTTSGEDMRDFKKTFTNKFRSKSYFKKHPRLGYLPVETVLEGNSLKMDLPPLVLTDSDEPSSVPFKAATNQEPNKHAASVSTTNNIEGTDVKVLVTNDSKQNADTSISPSLSFMHKSGAISSEEMHTRLGLYASRLSEVEEKRRESTPDWEDEHSLISQYCQSLNGTNAVHSLLSPMQIMMAMDAEQRTELETMIKDLEEENRVLQAEYDGLKQAQLDQNIRKSAYDPAADKRGDGSARDAEMIAEAKLLRQHKGRLEARMQILEDHNRQLDAQLQRLRRLLADQPPDSEMRIVTYPFSQTTATGDESSTPSQSALPRRGPPSFNSALNRTNGKQNYEVSNNMDNLLQKAEDVGKAMESLVTITTDEGTKTNIQLKQT